VNDETVRDLASRAGIAVDWIDANNRPQRVSANSLRRILDALDLDGEARLPRLITTTLGAATPLPDLRERKAAELMLEGSAPRSIVLEPAHGIPPITTPGYHRLHYGEREVALAVAPSRCLTLSDVLGGRRSWGLAVQLYSLRRAGDGGIGDTAALTALAQASANRGADAIAVSPTHSLFPHDLSRYQPYSPSSRLFLNPLLADPAAVLGEERVSAARNAGQASRGALIDWAGAAAAKYALLRRLFDQFELQDLAKNTALASAFNAFVREGGSALDDHTRFEARQGGRAAPILYYAFLQWIAFGAFTATQAAAKTAGMRIGIIGDLAIGVDRSGSQVSARPRDFLQGLSIGAPSDAFNLQGQDWDLTTFAPQALIANGFEPFIATVRANMRYCGGLRIDHAMGLMRLWLVPHGASPSEGAYLAFPFDDLLRLLALESHRNGTIVIGEDLGTVPPGFRRRCRNAGIAGMDVLWFQRDGTRFLPPGEWRDDAVAMTTTHDLPTVAGWWQGADLDLRRDLGMVGAAERGQRKSDRAALWQAFTAASSATGRSPPVDKPAPAVDAAVAYVSKTESPLALLPIEDVMGLVEQPNVPGTTNEHPNWRRRLDPPTCDLLQQPVTKRRLELLGGSRKQ
jgi:4-alpha-glucanotransferase